MSDYCRACSALLADGLGGIPIEPSKLAEALRLLDSPDRPFWGSENDWVIDFFERCIPPTSTSQQKKMNRWTGQFYHGEGHEVAKATYDTILMPHRPKTPVLGPVRVVIEMTWPWLKKFSDKTKAKGFIPHTSRPDLDNLAKGIVDRLVVLRFIGDDAMIAELVLRKFWGDKPGIRVAIAEIT